jgi:hypothetical protein
MRIAKTLGVIVLLAATTGAPRVWTQVGAITGQVIVRERANGDQSLLFLLTVPLSSQVDEIRLRGLGSFRFAAGLAPDGWSVEQDGGELRMRGMTIADPFRFRFDAVNPGRDRLDQRLGGRELETRGFLAGRRVFELKIRVTLQPKVVVQDSLETSLVVPRRIVSGSPFFVSAYQGFTAGRWSYGYENTWRNLVTSEQARLDPAYERLFSADFRNQPVRDGYRFELAPLKYNLSSTSPLRFAYDDEWGDTLVDAAATKAALRAGLDRFCPPAITSGAPLVFAGQPLCLSGCFPQPLAPFTLNGMEIHPAAGSPTTVEILMPNDLMPGPSFIEMGGGSSPARFPFRLLGVLGSIDQNLLWRGQSTTMRLEVLGTDQSLPIEIINRTPSIITIEGGERQVVNSAGGASNALQRSVRGISKGNFTINYRLTSDACGFDDE